MAHRIPPIVAVILISFSLEAYAGAIELFPVAVNGLQVDVNGRASSNGDYSPSAAALVTRIDWSWGDGQLTSGAFPQTHTYSRKGAFTLLVTAHFKDGSSASASQGILAGPGIVQNCCELAISAGPGGSVSYNASVGSDELSGGKSITLRLARANCVSLTAKPNPEYVFAGWDASAGMTGSDAKPVPENSSSIDILLNTPHSQITANFRTTELIVAERHRLLKLTRQGEVSTFLQGEFQIAQVRSNNQLFARQGRTVHVYDWRARETRAINVPQEPNGDIAFTVLPDDRMAFFNNMRHEIRFTTSAGQSLRTVQIGSPRGGELVCLNGVVSDGKLIFIDNGWRQVCAVDLATYDLSLVHDSVNPGPLDAIGYAEGNYYVCTQNKVLKVSSDSPGVQELATLPKCSITGILPLWKRLYVVVNGVGQARGGALYDVDPSSGAVTLLMDGLEYPQGIAAIAADDAVPAAQ